MSERIAVILAALRQSHLIVEEDEWYSCPQAKRADGSYASTNVDRHGQPCDCGADRHNALLDELAALLKDNP